MWKLQSTAVYVLITLLICNLSSATLLEDGNQRIINVNQQNGSNDTQCWDDQDHTCQTLDLALQGVQNLINLNITLKVIISAGEYNLQSDSNLTKFLEVENLSVIGQSGEMVVVNCHRSTGFAFKMAKNIRLENIMFNECQSNNAMPKELAAKNPTTVAGLAFYNSTNVILNNVTVKNTQGIATLFYNTMGGNVVCNCSFINNSLEDINKKDHRASGGLYILSFYCLENSTNSNCVLYLNPLNTSYAISDCTFKNNNASYREFILPRLSNASLIHFREIVSKGGGLSFLLHGYTKNNQITVRGCKFIDNSATWGGGAHICFRDYSKYNKIRFENCTFDSNISPNRLEPGGSHGGGADVVYLQEHVLHLHNNSVVFDGCTFFNNSALFGGGLSLQVSEIQGSGNTMVFTNTTFKRNKANVGAAADLSVSFFTAPFGQLMGYTGTVADFDDCQFVDNAFQEAFTSHLHTQRIGNGVLYIYKVPVRFKYSNTFCNNNGTSLVLAATRAILLRDSLLKFHNNYGIFGGALRFIEGSRLDISSGTAMDFEGNTASYLGGAIYVIYSDVHNEVYQSNCFLQYEDRTLDPKKWNVTFTFKNNIARNESNSIWSTSLVPCYQHDYDSDSNEEINSTFCWKNWNYIDSDCHSEVRSGGTNFKPKKNFNTVYPGIKTSVPLIVEDDLGNDVSSKSVLAAKVISGYAEIGDRDSFFRADSNMTILGKPNTTIKLALQTLGPSGFIQYCNVRILPCPPGFVLLPFNITDTTLPANYTPKCVCEDRNLYNGNVKCDQDSVTAVILNGYSMSYDNSTGKLLVGAIPFVTQGGQTQLPRNVSELDDVLCGKINRTGLLCGNCKDGLSVVMGFDTLDCINCTVGQTSSWLIFCAVQLFPTTLFFLFIILSNINAASAPFNAFIFFSQVMNVPIRYRAIYSWVFSLGTSEFNLNQYITAVKILFTPYTIWNLDFILLYLLDHTNICFMKDNNILLHLSLEYINAVYPLLLIGISYILIELHSSNFKPVVWLWKPFRNCFLRFKQTWNPKLSILNAFATFIIVSYVEFITTSVKLLSSVAMYSGNVTVRTGHYFNASITYFGPQHLPYAVLAIFVLCTFVLLPPLLMFLFPLKIVQKCIGKINCKFCNWQSLRIFVDVIQGSFKDGTNGTSDRRFFSGIYFVLRIVLILIYGVVTTVRLQYFFSISVLIIAIILFVVLQPYKDDFYNKFDTLIFIVMLIIHCLDFYNSYLNQVVGHAYLCIWVVVHVLFLVLLLSTITRGIVVAWKRYKIKKHRLRTPLKKDKTSSTTRNCRRRRSSLQASGRPRLVTISEVEISDELPDRLINPESYEYTPLGDHIHNLSQESSEDQITSRGKTKQNGHEEPRLLGERNDLSYGSVQLGVQDNNGNLLDSQEMSNVSS